MSKRSHKEHQEDKNSNVPGQNQAANTSTSPVSLDAAPPQAYLWTFWAQWVNVLVWDQFDKPLDAIYADQRVKVEENFGSGWFDINQDMTGNGTYLDPVGVWNPKPTPPVITSDPAIINTWLSSPNAPFKVLPLTIQDIPIRIGGHLLSNNVKRTLESKTPTTVIVKWL